MTKKMEEVVSSINGVDEVRRLQESLPYRPARDRFKTALTLPTSSCGEKGLVT